jgi:hypothetical protein
MWIWREGIPMKTIFYLGNKTSSSTSKLNIQNLMLVNLKNIWTIIITSDILKKTSILKTIITPFTNKCFNNNLATNNFNKLQPNTQCCQLSNYFSLANLLSNNSSNKLWASPNPHFKIQISNSLMLIYLNFKILG